LTLAWNRARLCRRGRRHVDARSEEKTPGLLMERIPEPEVMDNPAQAVAWFAKAY